MEHDVVVRWREILLEVVIPEKHGWDFMAEFGRVFATEDAYEGGVGLKPVLSYRDFQQVWHIKVAVNYGDESKFYSFLRKFCEARKISFKDPESEALAL